MTATYTFDGPERLAHRLAPYSGDQRMVFGASTYRELVQMLDGNTNGINVPVAWASVCATSPPPWSPPDSGPP
ncbi:hypothetical protein [Glycomyces harbinensis]|uniref:hypothetical protein n=1 Tax=Glycomyces harbinensis TaxID=58114 RepID=UPI00115F9310|nr:hypothetical protein [Glycomyces harbinensis]